MALRLLPRCTTCCVSPGMQMRGPRAMLRVLANRDHNTPLQYWWGSVRLEPRKDWSLRSANGPNKWSFLPNGKTGKGSDPLCRAPSRGLTLLVRSQHPDQLDWERKDDRRVLLCGDLGERLQVPQRHRGGPLID